MSWHFIVGEYIGGIILILSMWLIVKLFYPKKLIKEVRQKFEDEGEEKEDHAKQSWKELIQSKAGWSMVGKKYIGEWRMVWKDITVGFTIAGVIAAFVPPEAYEWLFVGTKAGGGGSGDFSFLQVLQHSVIGPVAAFLTFIGSMGNIPLASLLYENGVSVAGIMAFIFSDLVVFPVLRINAKYYNWRMSLYILMVLFVALVGASLILHYGFQFFDMVPQGGGGKSASEREFFKLDYSFYLNIGFILVTGLMIWLSRVKKSSMNHQMADKGWVEKLLFWLSVLAYGWLAIGLGIKYFYLG